MPTERSAVLVRTLTTDAETRRSLLAALAEQEAGTDLTDGLRIACASGRKIHLRPSGNAPELRLYVEAETREAAEDLFGSLHARVLASV